MRELNWKTEYPIRRDAEHKVSRRRFAAVLACGTCACAAASSGFDKLVEIARPQATEFIAVANISELAPGESKLVRYPTENDPTILLRLTSGEYRAYSQRCTHLLCPVHFHPEENTLHCPCHNGSFHAIDGSVNFGPPPRALPHYHVRLADGKIHLGPASEPAES